MFQGHRMVLKGRVQIGLGEMAGVARFREKTEIGQFKVLHHRRCFSDVRRAPSAFVRSVRESRNQKDRLDAQIGEEQR